MKSVYQVMSESEEILWTEIISEIDENPKYEQLGRPDVLSQNEDNDTTYQPTQVTQLTDPTIYKEGVYENYEDKPVELVVRFFTDLGDILRFNKIDSLKHKVFTKPMKLIEDCRFE
jgi:hypothetical protein